MSMPILAIGCASAVSTRRVHGRAACKLKKRSHTLITNGNSMNLATVFGIRIVRQGVVALVLPFSGLVHGICLPDVSGRSLIPTSVQRAHHTSPQTSPLLLVPVSDQNSH